LPVREAASTRWSALAACPIITAFNLPAKHVSFLRDEMTGWLDSLRSDLKTPEVVAAHDAMHGLLAVLEGGSER